MRNPFIALAMLLLGVPGGAFTVGQDAKVDKSRADSDQAAPQCGRCETSRSIPKRKRW